MPKITLKDGREAEMLVNERQDLCIICKNMLERLTSLLPSVPFSVLKKELIERIKTSSKIDDMMSIIESEVDFHYSIKNIQAYLDNEIGIKEEEGLDIIGREAY